MGMRLRIPHPLRPGAGLYRSQDQRALRPRLTTKTARRRSHATMKTGWLVGALLNICATGVAAERDQYVRMCVEDRSGANPRRQP